MRSPPASRELLVIGDRILLPSGPVAGWVHATDGRIVGVGAGAAPAPPATATVLHANGLTVAPGFVDVHVHGALGHETMDADPAGLREMARFFARHGVTAFLATTWTATRDRTLAALEAVAEIMSPVDGGAQVLGAHLEGPYLAASRCGAQDPSHIREADAEELTAFLETGAARLVTMAPERGDNLAAVRRCVDAGVTVSIGHTDATVGDVAAAVRSGATHVTHLFNAMGPFHHRDPGTVGAVLTEAKLRAELICDGIHVDAGAVDLAVRAKGVGGIVVMTDAVGPTGLDEGSYPFAGRRILHERGAMWLEDGTTLAGSALTFDRAVRNLAAATALGIEQLWPACSHNGAVAAGVADRKGTIAPGYDADLVLLDPDLQVHTTIVTGQVVFER